MTFAFLNSKAHLLLEQSATRVSGGAELQVALLSRELAARGHRVDLLHASLGGDEHEREVAGVRLTPCGPFHQSGIGDVVGAVPAVFGAIQRTRPDYVLVLGWTAWLYLLWLARRVLRYKLVFICGLDGEADGTFAANHGLRGRLFDFAMRHSDSVLAMSDRQQKMYADRGIPAGLYRNLLLARATPRTAPKDIDLLWVARCQPIKRPLCFLDLAAALPERKCLMVCPPEDERLWREVQSRAATIPNLELREIVPYHEIQAVYDRARVFVNTSEVEGYANSFIQAAQGGAALLSLSVDCDDVITTFQAGHVAGNDPDALATLARSMLADDESLSRMAGNAGRFVCEWHDNTRNVDLFLDALEKAPSN